MGQVRNCADILVKGSERRKMGAKHRAKSRPKWERPGGGGVRQSVSTRLDGAVSEPTVSHMLFEKGALSLRCEQKKKKVGGRGLGTLRLKPCRQPCVTKCAGARAEKGGAKNIPGPPKRSPNEVGGPAERRVREGRKDREQREKCSKPGRKKDVKETGGGTVNQSTRHKKKNHYHWTGTCAGRAGCVQSSEVE